MKKRLVMLVIVIAVSVLAASSLVFAADFHINPQADSVGKKDAEKFVGQPVSAVTAALGSPSMVRDNVTEPNLINYIYIGYGTVYTFFVEREGKQVTAAYKDKRGGWESGIYPTYPAKTNK